MMTTNPDVVQPTPVTQCELAVGVDSVVADPVVRVVEGDSGR